ncbi:vitellogenin receptor isoform X1 [Apis florea]|uniref:vitellogenin receptor isoform X1 n=2 Tax=Apis florea TaxID=7463 RepID=UPI00062978D0|nr:vitellogenin receptor isoform X1 [Apis florea]XP_031776204.1 vitellogenin receptor isoform X1 [Apis florea]
MYRNLFVFFVLTNLYCSSIDTTVIRCDPPDFFHCKNGKCISSLFRCDGENECGDNSDEMDCNGETNLHMIRCTTDEFQCADHSCIPEEKFCDAKSDCYDGSDEYIGCVKELKCNNSFRCKDSHCIRKEWVCDGVPDCPDKSDEEKCESNIISIEECNNEYDRYLCKNQRCIFLNATCDEKNDCGDNSDEDLDACKKADASCKLTAKCQHNCRKTPKGGQCSCRSGYKLINNQTCTDINECDNYGICDQQCINSAGSYTCFCQPGYVMQDDKKTCKAEGGEATMVFSIKSEIHGYYLDSQIYFPISQNLQHAVAVSLDANYVYWSDIENGNEAIVKSLEDGSQREIIVTTGLSSPDNIAVDWVTDNIYFTDSGYMHIGVCNDDGSYCTVIIKERRDKPRGLALLPSSGIFYWTEWGMNSSILMAGMDGKNITVLVNQDLEWPNSLSIDYPNNRLYWIDTKQKMIESIRLDGTDRRIVLKGTAKKPFSLAVFENKLYWSDWISNTIQSCDKFSGKDWETLVNTNNTVYGVHIYHSVLKPKIPNPCNSKPCSQLCLLNSQNGYTCACSLDKELNYDNHTCRAIKKKMHLIIAAGNTFIDYYHELLGKPKMATSVMLKRVTAIAYNPLTDGLLASDQLTDTIFHLNTHTGEVKSVITIENEILGGMDFDYIGNNVYLSDVKHKTIEVHSLNSKEKTIFYFKDEPYDIALVPEEGIMMVVFRRDELYHIDLMNMNGLGPKITIVGNKTVLIGPKISLSYDGDFKQLFWSDQGSGRIGSTTIPGFETYILRTGLSEPVSLALLGDYLFWTQYKSNQLYWTSKTITKQYQKRITLQTPEDLDKMQLIGMHKTYVKEHLCRKNNGNCSHVCLLSNNPSSYICACPPDMMLNIDNRKCNSQTTCNTGEIKCGEHDKCIKSYQRCDGIIDCPSGEDESSSFCEDFHWSICKHQDQFRCKNGECISKSKYCNSHYDCSDRSDEEGCVKKECDSNEFQCHEGACISKYLVCNGYNDCTDLSDELNCNKHKCDNDSFACEIGTCIPKTWKCDGEVDCPDGSDESETCQRKKCPSEMFTCFNGRCIDLILKCNGISECEDDSDEKYCNDKSTNNYVNCTADEYKCFDSDLCLPKQFRCDGIKNCPKNDDERDCARCNEAEYVCENKKCIEKSWVCDRVDDCGDGSDERNCDGSNWRTNSVSMISNCKEFKCSNGICLPFNKVCDGKIDCLDQSDEFGDCEISCTKNNPCTNMCHKTPTGPVCTCRNGYHLSSDLKTCEDIDECKKNVCSQICHNTNGSFTCSCYEGYVIRSDKTSCKVAGSQMEIITVSGTDIRKLSPNLNSIELIYKEVDFEINGIDVNTREDTIYWSNEMLGMINKIHVKTKERKTVTGLGRPEALAVDWITDNVYFNDNDYTSSIQVCNLEQKKCAKIVSIAGKNRVISIAVEPKKGWLFWSQTSWAFYDRPMSKIYRSNTMGNNATAIVHLDLGLVLALTIDYARSKLYWSDTHFKNIESSNLDGSNRAVVLNTDIHQAMSINIYEDSLYWLMGGTGIIRKCKLYGDKLCTTISIGTSNINKYFIILHTIRQPIGKNVCEKYKCNYMCVLGNNGPACICPNGYSKDSKNICSENMNTRLIFNSSLVTYKNESIRHQNGTLIGIIITVLICIIIGSAYFYYQKIKPNFSKKNNLSIHFQNPSYDQRNEIAPTLNCISGLPPGEHEYVNPIIDIQKNQNENITQKNEKQMTKILNFDRSDNESEESAYKQDISLI